MPEPRDPLLKVLIHFRGAPGGAEKGSELGEGPRGACKGLVLWSIGGRLGPGLRRARGRDPAEATVW